MSESRSAPDSQSTRDFGSTGNPQSTSGTPFPRWRSFGVLAGIACLLLGAFVLWNYGPDTDSAELPAGTDVSFLSASEAPAASETDSATVDQAREMLKNALQKIEAVRGYTYVFYKQERVNGVLRPRERIAMKIRHHPFSVYANYLSPEEIKGREGIYVEGLRDGKIIGHAGGFQALFGSLEVDPEGMLAMQGNRHPITSAGIRHLMRKWQAFGADKAKRKNFRIRVVEGVQVDNRDTQMWEFFFEEPIPEIDISRARIYLDTQYGFPIRYQAWAQPTTADQEPPLVEDYIYTQIHMNPGLTDQDFDPKNPDYHFSGLLGGS